VISWHRRLACYLRFLGAIDCLALIAAFLPRQGMEEFHGHLGLGELPGIPLTGYLARSASLMYVLHGLTLFYLATDVVRYRGLIGFLAGITILQGILLVGIDSYEGLPTWWIWGEGPLLATSGMVTLILLRLGRHTNDRL
jgi:hypothetical protein